MPDEERKVFNPRSYYMKFTTKAVMDSMIVDNQNQYPIGTFGVDLSTGNVYVAVGEPTAWSLVGAQ